MLHLKDVFQCQDVDNLCGSPGIPWKDNGFDTKEDIIRDPDAIQSIRRFWHFIKRGEDYKFPACYVFKSCLRVEGKSQDPLVWVYPATVSFGEAVFAIPLIKAYKESCCPIAYDQTISDKKQVIEDRFSCEKYGIGFKFTEFEKKIPSWLLETAFDILMLQIDFLYYQGHGIADVRRMVHMFTAIRNYFINTPICIENIEQRYHKCTGIAKDSYFAQLIRSIVSCILSSWMFFEQNSNPPADILFFEDECILPYLKHFKVKDAAELMSSIGMMKLNIELYKIQKSS